MSQTLTISDDLYRRLETAAQERGVTIEYLLRTWPVAATDRVESTRDEEATQAATALAAVATLGDELSSRYGEMPDSTGLIRVDRER